MLGVVALGLLVEHLLIFRTHTKRGHKVIVERNGYLVALYIDIEIGNYLLVVDAHALGQGGPGAGVQAHNVGNGITALLLANIEFRGDGIPTFFGKIVVAGGEDAAVQGEVALCTAALNLQQQALLQGACRYACRLKRLHHFEHLLYLLLRRSYGGIKEKFVLYFGKRFMQKAVIVERAYQILSYGTLLRGERELAKLFYERIAKGLGIAHGYIHGGRGIVIVPAVVIGDIIDRAVIVGRIKFVGRDGIGDNVLGLHSLKSGIVDNLSTHTILYLYGCEFQEARHQHLLWREGECLQLLLLLRLRKGTFCHRSIGKCAATQEFAQHGCGRQYILLQRYNIIQETQ